MRFDRCSVEKKVTEILPGENAVRAGPESPESCAAKRMRLIRWRNCRLNECKKVGPEDSPELRAGEMRDDLRYGVPWTAARQADQGSPPLSGL